MPILPVVKGRQVIAALERAGFVIVHYGDHVKMRHSDGRRTIVPNHPGDDILPKTLRSILKQAAITEDEFRALL
jgi:predicted RNA binding protein YcfA (HicA-like mRNA interferase family)